MHEFGELVARQLLWELHLSWNPKRYWPHEIVNTMETFNWLHFCGFSQTYLFFGFHGNLFCDTRFIRHHRGPGTGHIKNGGCSYRRRRYFDHHLHGPQLDTGVCIHQRPGDGRI